MEGMVSEKALNWDSVGIFEKCKEIIVTGAEGSLRGDSNRR